MPINTFPNDSNVVPPIPATDIADGSVSDTEFQYLDGVTSNIQDQLDAIPTILRSYLAETVTYNDDATLGDTALSVTVAAGGIYDISLVVHSTSAVKALNMDFAGTATIANFIGEWYCYQTTDFTIGDTKRVTAAGTDFSVIPDGADAFATFTGSVEITDAGTFLLRGAQNASNASDTTILRGSTLTLTKMG